MRRFCIAVLLAAAGGPAIGEEVNQIWEEYGRRITASSKIEGLGPNLFGDHVSLSNGALSFSVTDVSLPGNNGLPVEFRRSFSVKGRKGFYINAGFPLADWEIDLPSISGVFAPDWVSGAVATPGKRCSVTTVGAARPPTVVVGVTYFSPKDYWQGHSLSLPAGGGGEMLLLDPSSPRPTVGGPFYWTTADQTRLACLPSIKNWSGGGEGFLAVAPDGTRYWFDWMAQDLEPVLEASTIIEVLGNPKTLTHRQARRRNVLYPTRVEDRFGNRVTYTYTNARTEPVRLTSIVSSDSRRIDINYNQDGYVSSVVAHGRTWSYQYAAANSVDKTLSVVTLPDASSWSIDFAGLLNSKVEYHPGIPGEPWRSCVHHPGIVPPEAFTGRVTHPSGAVGEFTVKVQQHGRTNVPLNCENFTHPHNYDNDDVSFWAISYHGLSLSRKVVTGTGLPSGTWTYEYNSPRSWYKPGGEASHPVCPVGMDCSVPRCTSDDCAGSARTTVTDPVGNWTRYYHGNSYRYNEGKLLKVEEGSGSAVLRTTWNMYDLTQLDHEYPAKWGTSPRMIGDGFTSEFHRPLIRRSIVQDGASFNYSVSTFDHFARPVNATRSRTAATGSSPDPVAGTPSVSSPAASTSGAFAVTWTSVEGVTGYRLEQRRDGGSWSQVYSGSGTSKSVSSLANGRYDYRARACHAQRCGSYSAIATTVVTLPPGSPPAVTTPASAGGAFTVSWTAVATATSYRLEQRKGSGAWAQIYSGTGRSRALSGLTNGKYQFRARACNASGCSGYSALGTTTVLLPPATAPTLTVPVTAPTRQNYTVRWTAVATASSYELQVRHNGGSWTRVYGGGGLNHTQSQTAEGTYTYRVRACNATGCGAYSATKSVQLYGGGGGPCLEPPCTVPNAIGPGEGWSASGADGEGS